MKKTLACLFLCGCGFTTSSHLTETDTKAIPARRGTVIADGCLLDPWQIETLQTPAAKLVIQDVVLDCLLPHSDGTVAPGDASSRAQLDALVSQLHAMGYTVSLAASFVTDNGYVFDGAETAKELADPNWVASVASGIATLASGADAVDLDFEQLPPSVRTSLTQFVGAMASKVRPAKKLDVFLPPGDPAFDVQSLAKYTDRFRVMTLDFSGDVAGPTIDSGWAVDTVRAAQASAGNAAVDVSFPLYGNDFTTSGTVGVRFTTYFEALGLADTYHVAAQRGATQELFLDYTDDANHEHELWYDDAQSTLITLSAWDAKTLPATVGVTYYGFGAEDPALWSAIAQASQ